MEGLAGVRASCGSMPLAVGGFSAAPKKIALAGVGDIFLLWSARNPLKSPELDEGIQTNPRESKPVSLVFLGLAWIRLGAIWLETRLFSEMRGRLAFACQAPVGRDEGHRPSTAISDSHANGRA